MATINLEALRKEIEEDRKNLAEKEAAYEAMLRYLHKREGVTAAPAQTSADRTLREEIEDVLVYLDGEFTNSDVESLLKREGIRPRITQELNKLVDMGKLVCVHVGQGRAPSRFRRKRQNNKE